MKFFRFILTLAVAILSVTGLIAIILLVTGQRVNYKNIFNPEVYPSPTTTSQRKNPEVYPSPTTTSQRKPLPLTVPELAIVQLKNGSSYTGKLTVFNANSLKIEDNGNSETLPLSQVKEIEFQGDVYIDNPDGRIRRVPWRGGEKILQVPITAFKLGNPPRTAILNLDSLTPEGYSRLSENFGKTYGIKKILMDSSEKVTIKIEEIE